MLDSSQSDFLERNLGGQMYWKMLVDAGHSKDEVRELLEFHAQNREKVITFMGGQEVYDSIPPDWREALFVLSTLRYLCDWLDAWRPRRQEAPVVVDGYVEEVRVP